MTKSQHQYDVFISHAVEDKIAIANELCQRLEEKKLKVWYSGAELSVGDRLNDTIFNGLDQCRFGVVIISPTYISKIWSLAEFFTLLTKEKQGHKVILPVLHDITPQELGARSPLMADIYAIPASKGLDVVAEKLFDEITRQKNRRQASVINWKKYAWVASVLITVIALAFWFAQTKSHALTNEFIQQSIEQRITEVQSKANALRDQAAQQGAVLSNVNQLKNQYSNFKNLKSYFRNEYTLNTLQASFHSKRSVEAALQMDMDVLSPLNEYALVAPIIYELPSGTTPTQNYTFLLLNAQPLGYKIIQSEDANDEVIVHVTFENPIRVIEISYLFPSPVNNNTKRYKVSLTALKPSEVFTFSYSGKEWTIKSIE